MRRIAYLTDFGFMLFCLFFSGSNIAGEAPPEGQELKPVPAVVHGYCYADAKTTVYFSAAFSSPPLGGPGGRTQQEILRILGNTREAWRSAFEAYLKQKHGNAGFVLCAMQDSLPLAQTAWQALLGELRRDNAGYYRKFVETGWVYSVPANSP